MNVARRCGQTRVALALDTRTQGESVALFLPFSSSERVSDHILSCYSCFAHMELGGFYGDLMARIA